MNEAMKDPMLLAAISLENEVPPTPTLDLGLPVMNWNPMARLTPEEMDPPPQCVLRIKR